MKYASFLVAALLAASVAMTANVARSEQTQSGANDLHMLTTMPLEFVVETTFRPQITRLQYDDDKAAIQAEIAALPQDVRTLFWLCYLEDATPGGELHTFFTKAAEDRKIADEAKKILIEQGQAGAEDTLQQFNRMNENADPARQADVVSKALSDAGLTRQAQAFADARALSAKNADGDFAGFDAAFGSKSDFEAAMRGYVERSPSLVAWAKDARAKIGDEDRLGYLAAQIQSMDAAQIDGLPKPMKQIFVVSLFNDEMLNGGVHQFFFNSSGQYAPDVVDALREIGLSKHADVVQRGIDMFGKPYQTDTPQRRQLHFAKDWSDWDEKLSSLTNDVDDGQITPALITFAKRENVLPQ